MNDLTNKQSGLLFGSYSADALSLGVHWIYDTNELAQKHGRVSEYKAPGADSYHPHKQAGDQGHVGDQSLCLLKFLVREKKWSHSGFMDDWLGMWPIAPLVCHLANSTEEEVVRASVEQTILTHRSPEAEESATFLAKAGYRLIHGANLLDTLNEIAPGWALKKADSLLSENAVDAIGKLGPACSISSALPSVLYLALKHGDDIETAFIENAMAGGDNCARGLVLGMLLGAANGMASIPNYWVENLRARSDLVDFLNQT
ncbi:MAG: ADP-ribosylglycohydrolase family protein [Opitutae bacterium]|nr:ADP-ribosylglycohydrolase family protein [Opitutae bacterium]